MPHRKQTKNISHKVGLDIGSHSIKGVETIERGSEIVIRSAGAVAMSKADVKHQALDSPALVQAVKSLWSSAKFQSKKVILSLPAESVYMKWLHLESSNEEELDSIARTTATRGAPFPTNDAIVDYRVISSHVAGAHKVYYVMLVAAASSAVRSLLNLTERAGLEPVAVDISAVSALRSFENQKKTNSPLWSDQPRAHCIIGASSTTIIVIRNNALEFARTVPVGGDDFTQCIVGAIAVDWQLAEKIKNYPSTRLAEDSTLIVTHKNNEFRIPAGNVVSRLSREILRSLRFFSSQFAEGSYLGMIGTATLSGGGALLRGIDTSLQQHGIEINGIINPFAGFSVYSDNSGIGHFGDKTAAFTTAMGLAMGNYSASDTDSLEVGIAA